PKRYVIGNLIRPAYCAKEYCIMLANLRFPVVGHHLTVLLVIVARRKIKMIEMKSTIEFRRHCFKHAQALRHHLFADTVPGNDCYTMGIGSIHIQVLVSGVVSINIARKSLTLV